MLPFDDYHYLYPPRPATAVGIADLKAYERRGYVAQVKKNGTCNVLAVSPRRELRCMTRHGPEAPHRQWTPTPASSRGFRSLVGGWYVFAAELLHAKGRHIKDTNYIFDILVADGQYLVGTTFAERQGLLAELFVATGETVSHSIIDPHLWVARSHRAGFQGLYKGLRNPEDEGLVLKDPGGVLQLCFNATSNRQWQVKCLSNNACQ